LPARYVAHPQSGTGAAPTSVSVRDESFTRANQATQQNQDETYEEYDSPFLEDHERTLAKDDLMKLYHRSLGDEASALLQELEERGLYPLEKLKSYELAANAHPHSPLAIRRLAKTLGTIGHRKGMLTSPPLRVSPEAATQERCRERIEEWRSVTHDFGTDRFADTDTYSQMKLEGLRPEVVKMFEAPRTVHIGNEARGDTAYRSTPLDEVARIERKWGLI
jgi:hypothetical protein